MAIFQRWDVEAREHAYLESEISRLEDCLWWRGVKGSSQPSGLAEHKNLSAGDTEGEAFWSARSHPGKCPEGKRTYGARVQRRSQNGFNIPKMLTTWDKAETREEASPTPSPIQNTRRRGQALPIIFRHVPSVNKNWEGMVLTVLRKAQGPARTEERRSRKCDP